MDWSLQEVVQVTGATVVRWPKGDRMTIAKTVSGPGTLYFPLGGYPEENTLRRLAQAGASGVVLYEGRPASWASLYPDLGILTLPSPADGYFKLAAEARNRAAGPVVGITGSSGKTSTKEYVSSILKARYQVHSTIWSFNLRSDGAGILLAMEGRPDEAAVIEMGFGHVGDIDRMATMARPNAGIITKVTLDHLDGAGGSWDVLIREKGKLGHHIPPEGLLAMNADDPGCQRVDRSGFKCRVVTFGAGESADVRYEDAVAGETGTTMTLNLFGQRYPVRLCNFGLVQAANAAAAAVVAHGLGLTAAEIVDGLQNTPPLPRRFQIHRFQHGLTVIDDTWSASVDAMTQGLQTAAALAGRRRKIAVVSGIGNLRDRGPELHRQMGELVPRSGYSELFLIAPDERTAAMREGALAGGLAPEQIHEVAQKELPAALATFAAANTLIYCKASQYLWLPPQMDEFLALVKTRGFEPRV